MSETPTVAAEPQGAPETPDQPGIAGTEPAPQSAPAQETDWKTEARKWEQLAKKYRPAADKLAEIEESQKTQEQKLQEQAAQAKADADAARAEALHYRLAAAHGVDAEHFDLLGTGDEETVTARAQKVGALLALKADNARLTAELDALRQGKPLPVDVKTLKSGASPDSQPSDTAYPSNWLPRA